MNDNRATLIEAITLKEANLARLDVERQTLLDGLNDLRQQLSAINAASPPAQETSTLSSTAKITLFRSLFRGREDVYPKLWISKNGDRKGYMPACANDGNYSLCGKRKFPRVKCGDCNHQAYLPVSDEVIREHLQGKQTIGVYPLLPDDTCRFLAVDFDKTTWQEDVAAFRETCSTLDIPVAVERSRWEFLSSRRKIFGQIPLLSFSAVFPLSAVPATCLKANVPRVPVLRQHRTAVSTRQLGPCAQPDQRLPALHAKRGA